MNTFEKLLKADSSRADQRERKVITSRRLAFICDEKEPMEITIEALEMRDLQFIQEFLTDSDGNVRPERYLDSNIKICALGIVDPDFSSEGLLAAYKCRDKESLIEKIFQTEVSNIATEIISLTGADKDLNSTVEEIKNS